MAEPVTLAQLGRDLARRWRVAAGVTLAVVAGAVVYGQVLPDQFESSAVVAFSPKAGSGVGGDTLRVILPKYVAYSTARATETTVAAATGESLDRLRSAVSAGIATDTGNLSIRVRLPSAARAARVANALSSEVERFAASDPLFDAQVVSPALPSSTPAGPPRTLLALAALVVGVVLGLAAAFALERGRPRVRTLGDISTVSGYPVVGRIPTSRSLRGPPVGALDDPVVGAAVRTLRTNVERLAREQTVRSVLVTSPLGGEGKTTLASAWAAAMARVEADVLLIDADLRRPGVARQWGLPGVEHGLAGVLRKQCPLREGVVPTPIDRLHLLPTDADPDAGDLLARRFAEVLEEARGEYQIVVVDSPPLLGTDDARTLATVCDATLLVVSLHSLSEQVTEAAAALNVLGVKAMGVVANRLSRRGAFWSYDYY